LAFLCHWSNAEIIGGMYSYNAVLAAIAALLITQQKRLVFFAILLSILFTKCMFLLALPALTFPFILAIWCVAWGIEFSQRRQKVNE
jgi:urea transporter